MGQANLKQSLMWLLGGFYETCTVWILVWQTHTRNILQNKWTVFSKNVNVIKIKKGQITTLFSMNLSNLLQFKNLLGETVAHNYFLNIKDIWSANTFLFLTLVICAFSSSLWESTERNLILLYPSQRLFHFITHSKNQLGFTEPCYCMFSSFVHFFSYFFYFVILFLIFKTSI